MVKRILVKITRHYHAVKNTRTTLMKVVKNTERRAIMHREARGITCTSNCQATNFASLSLQPCKTRNVSAEPRIRVVLYSAIETRAKCFLPRCLLLLVQGNLEIANEWQRILFQVNSATNFSFKIYFRSSILQNPWYKFKLLSWWNLNIRCIKVKRIYICTRWLFSWKFFGLNLTYRRIWDLVEKNHTTWNRNDHKRSVTWTYKDETCEAHLPWNAPSSTAIEQVLTKLERFCVRLDVALLWTNSINRCSVGYQK